MEAFSFHFFALGYTVFSEIRYKTIVRNSFNHDIN